MIGLGTSRGELELTRERMGSGGPRGLQILRLGVESARGGFDSHAFPPARAGSARLALLLALAVAAVPAVAARAAGAPVDSLARPASTVADSVPHPASAPLDTLGRAVTPPGGAPVAADSLAGRAAPPPAAPATADTMVRRRGRIRERTASPDTAETAPRGFLAAPRWVMMRSLLFPGWGQLQNHAWLKAALLGGTDGYLRVRAFQDEHRLREMQPGVNAAQAAYNQAFAAANAALAARNLLTPGTPEYQAADSLYQLLYAVEGSASAKYNSLVGPYNSLLNGQVSRLWLLGGVIVYAMVDAYVDAHFKNFKVEFQHDPALPGGKPASGRTRLFLRWTF